MYRVLFCGRIDKPVGFPKWATPEFFCVSPDMNM